jgi:hypothetical protein
MYNRYVDGLATWAPTDADLYRENGRRLADEGYLQSTAHLPAAQKECALSSPKCGTSSGG